MNLVFQKAIHHYGCCYKIYAFFGEAGITLRNSLPTKDLYMKDEDGKEVKPWYSKLELLSRVGLDPEYEKVMQEKDLLPKAIVDSLVDAAEKKGGLRCFDLDVIIEEETHNFYLIDLNDMPSYQGIPGIADRAFLKLWEAKTKKGSIASNSMDEEKLI